MVLQLRWPFLPLNFAFLVSYPPDDCRKASLVVHFGIILVRVRVHIFNIWIMFTFIGLRLGSLRSARTHYLFLKNIFGTGKIFSSLIWLFEFYHNLVRYSIWETPDG